MNVFCRGIYFLAAGFVWSLIAYSDVNVSSINVKEYGAVGDGERDDGPSIQKALDEAGQDGVGEVFLPTGTYRIEDHLTIPSGVTMRGVWQSPHHEDQVWGTVLHAVGYRGKEDGPAFIQLSPSSAVKGLTIYYPEQTFPDIAPYPWTIQGRGMHGSVMDTTLVNAYQGIDFGTHNHELHYIRNVYGTVLRRGIFIDRCTDIGRIENVHFNPHYWFRANVPKEKRVNGKELIDYLNNNTEVFIFGRSDWEYVHNTFAFGFDKCYKFIRTRHGACNGNFLGIGADGGTHAIWVEDAWPYGILITNGEFVTFAGDRPVQIVTEDSFKGVVQFNNCSFWGPTHHNALIRGQGHVSFQQCNFVNWGRKDDPKAHSLRIESGNVNVNSCRFAESKPQIYLGPNVTSAVVMGNNFTGNIQVDNQSKGDVQIGLNVTRQRKK